MRRETRQELHYSRSELYKVIENFHINLLRLNPFVVDSNLNLAVVGNRDPSVHPKSNSPRRNKKEAMIHPKAKRNKDKKRKSPPI